MKTHTTREGWLVAAVAALDKRFFAENGYELPEKLQVSCGFPKGSPKAIGQCFDPKVSADGTTHMFISPTLGERVMRVLDTLLHEMVHASVGIKCKHGGAFRGLMLEFGFTGKLKSVGAEPGTELYKTLEVIAGRLGKYPHAPMSPKKKVGRPTNGWIRLQSLNEDGYKIMISPKMMDECGAPSDPWGDEMVPV